MKSSSMIGISTIFLVLILFSGELLSLPLSRTCYTLSEESLELALSSEFITAEQTRRMDRLSLNAGITDTTTTGAEIFLLNAAVYGGEQESGDILLNFWHYTGRYLRERLDTGFQVDIRIPSGPDPEKDPEWQHLSEGKSELKAGAVLSYRLYDREICSLNLSYIFRQGDNEDFYGGFRYNPAESETYKSVLGLNPFSRDSFLSTDRMADDYVTAAISLMSLRPAGFVVFSELYAVFYNSGSDDTEVYPADDKYYFSSDTEFLISAGCKYIVTDSTFFHIFGALNPFAEDRGLKKIIGAGINIVF